MGHEVKVRDERPGVFQTMVDAVNRSFDAQSDIYRAFAIADDTARSDIECCAHQQQVHEDGGYWIYSTTDMRRLRATMTDAEAATQPFAINLPEALDMLVSTQRAAEYIRRRGNVFPWRMVDVPDMPGYVRFVDREGRPIDPGTPA